MAAASTLPALGPLFPPMGSLVHVKWLDALQAFEQGRDALLNLEYGRFITLLIMAAYLSHEKKRVVDLADASTLAELETYVPLIQQGKGRQVL